jgi:hypothetical protein
MLIHTDPGGLFAPKIQEDGTRVFAFPLGKGHLPLETLQDLGTFARIMFEDREGYSGKTLNTVSHFATGQEIAATTARIAGVKAVYIDTPIDEWVADLPYADAPVHAANPEDITVGENFRMWWPGFQESILLKHRDVEALRKIHPGLQSLEQWMVQTGYDGTPKPLLKGFIDNNMGPGF